MPPSNTSRLTATLLIVLGSFILLIGLSLLVGGFYLVALGGSWYFALAGAGLAISGVLMLRRRRSGALAYLLVFAGSVCWSVLDVGLTFWPLFSRLFALAVISVPVLVAIPYLRSRQRGTLARLAGWLACVAAAGMVVGLCATLYAALQPQPILTAERMPAPVPGKAVGTVEPACVSAWAVQIRICTFRRPHRRLCVIW